MADNLPEGFALLCAPCLIAVEKDPGPAICVYGGQSMCARHVREYGRRMASLSHVTAVPQIDHDRSCE